MGDLKKTLITACEEAGKILMANLGKLKEIEAKTIFSDIVTNADKQSEKTIIEIIKSSFPEHTIIAEESGIGNDGSDYKWIIDPLDGTLNYTHTFPFFCVSIGLEYQKKIIMGGVFAPALNEFYFAERGNGSTLNGKQIHVSKTENLDKTLTAFGFAHNTRFTMDDYLPRLTKVMMNTQGVLRLGSAALDFCNVAVGRIDAFYERGIYAWDTAAGSIIVEEAGGKVTDYNGNKFSPYSETFLATNEILHDKMIELIS